MIFMTVVNNDFTSSLSMICQVEKCFAKFIKLFHENKAEWTTHLTDLGKGDPPIEFLVACEEGVRSYGGDLHAMGSRPLRSRRHWGFVVATWRKKESYIALGRYLLRHDDGYKQWDCFLFSDYSIRRKLTATFTARHLPLSNGRDEENFSGKFVFDWSKHAWSPVKRKSKADSYLKPEPKTTSSSKPVVEGVTMIFDVELDRLVPL